VSRRPPVLALVATLALLTGCASGTVEVGYPAGAANRTLLSSTGPRRVVVSAVTDRRTNQQRIGSRPENGKPIVTARPVGDIVRDALLVELGRNGHEVVPGAGDVVIAADVEEFWLDATGRSVNTQYIGRVAIAIAVADGATGERLLERRYVGVRRRTGEADAKEVWREVMDVALVRTIHDLATDPELAAALAAARR
jgi:uncharacterized lipoprotein YajG